MLKADRTIKENTIKLKDERKIPIRLWLTFPVLTILGTAILIIAGLLIRSSFKNSKMILDQVQNHMKEEMKIQIIQKLDTAEQLNNINYHMFESGILDIKSKEGRERYFSNILESYPDAAMSFMGLENGYFYGARRNLDGEIQVARKDETTAGASFYYSIDDLGTAIKLEEEFPNFDPRTRAWYLSALEQGKPVYSQVYMHFSFQEPTITASRPIYDKDNQLIGVFGVNYLLSWIDSLLDKLVIGESGEMFLTDNEGLLLSTTIDMEKYKLEEDSLELININEAQNPYIEKVVEKLEDISNGGRPNIKVNGKKYNLGLINLKQKNLNWKLYFLVSEDDFMKDIKVSIYYAIGFAGLLLILGSLTLTWISVQIVRPIEKISLATEGLSKGSVKEIKNRNKIKELYGLTASFNEMGKKLANMVANLEVEISNRTHELECTNKELENLSFKDGLTGIYNRRKFDEFYKNAWNITKEEGKNLGVLMLDIDYFKKYNDTYGHLVGDECLKIIACNLEKDLRRRNDLLARYGGEEFIILIQEAREKDLEILAERIRKDIENLGIEHIESEFKVVTISIGLAIMTPDESSNPQDLIKKSDIALYKAKNAGRNTIYKYDGP